jgi:NarL family two-component system response regulator LiaR
MEKGRSDISLSPRGAGAAGDRDTIRVLVVDDHPMVRDIIALACRERPALQVVAEASDGLEALELSRRLLPDVLVLDLGLPHLDGFEVIRLLRQDQLAIRILVVSARDDDAAVFECSRLGADGYLDKTVSVTEIAEAVEAVAAGIRVFTVQHQRGAHDNLREIARRSRETARLASILTRREVEVLELIALGLTTRQTASRLGVSDRTVETHVGNIYEKLDVRTRVQAMRRATAFRLVDLHDDRPILSEA